MYHLHHLLRDQLTHIRYNIVKFCCPGNKLAANFSLIVQSKATCQMTVYQFAAHKVNKGDKISTNIKGMKFHTKFNFEYTQTCSFRGNLPAKSIPVHITAIGKGGKKGAIFHSQLKLLSSVCKHVHSKAIYLLSVHQFTAQQVGKEGTIFHSSHKILS